MRFLSYRGFIALLAKADPEKVNRGDSDEDVVIVMIPPVPASSDVGALGLHPCIALSYPTISVNRYGMRNSAHRSIFRNIHTCYFYYKV